MANKRSLKKAVKATCGDIAGECVLARTLIPGIDGAKIEEAILCVADLQFTTIEAVTFSFDKGRSAFDSARAYRAARQRYFRKGYAKLRDDFRKGLEEVVAKMNASLPASEASEAAEAEAPAAE